MIFAVIGSAFVALIAIGVASDSLARRRRGGFVNGQWADPDAGAQYEADQTAARPIRRP